MPDGSEHCHCRIGRVTPKGNIVLFPGTPAPELPVNLQPEASIVELLEGLLARARTGELRAVAAAYVKTGDYTSFNWALGILSTHQLCAAISDLGYAYSASRDKAATEVETVPGDNE